MRIEGIFKKDIFRSINGVVKADQLDESSIWQELDEFVVTKELDLHLRRFFSLYTSSLDMGRSPEAANQIGIWVSGFFGSGKSHFIKVLSYLLDNGEHEKDGEVKRAVDFFKDKITDATVFGDIKKAVAAGTDVALFNIDSKADSQSGRDAILSVFLKVFNEKQGYSGDHAHIAHMERYLDGKGKLRDFHSAYENLKGTAWSDDRDAYQFNRDEVIAALSETLAQSKESAEKWVDNAEGTFSLTVENFAKWVKEYLDSKGPQHRIIFFVDEVGQFIGSDTHLMLNLQTITEELGTLCEGRAWVVVTSQEDIDAVIGEMKTAKANDFSKIQGRFKTRLSLSSANVDEVIQERLLSKAADAIPELEALFNEKGDILRNQLTFTNVGTTFKRIAGPDDFAKNYPFVPYQFKLLQRIFESIRKAGATGLHLAQGERSLLDAFQSAVKAVANENIGVLVPLYRFYPAIESFLDSAVKRTIDHASENASLEPLDVELLKVLFLIRYVDEFKGNTDNLVTLCLDEIDADRLALRRRIEESLQRLENQTLVSRSGDLYFFLTDEERDVNREIKSVSLASGEEARLLGELIFQDLLKDQRKHRYSANKMDFPFNRICDQYPVGNRADGAMTVSVLSPLAEEYEEADESKCVMDSSSEEGRVIIRLPDEETLGLDVRTYLKTEKYIRTKDDGTLPTSTRRIHRDLADENRTRRERLHGLLRDMLAKSKYFVAGERLSLKASGPQLALAESLEYLIQNTFTKMKLLATLHENPLQEIQALLRSDDIAQSLDLNLPESNPEALKDVREYLELSSKMSRQIVMHDMISARYANRPYGWPPYEVVLLLARLYAAGEIQFIMKGGAIPRAKVYESISSQNLWRNITIVQKKTSSPEDVRRARELGREVFSEMGPEGEEMLAEFLRRRLTDWKSALSRYRAVADSGSYPGGEEIADGLSLIDALLALEESGPFLTRFDERKSDLLELSENFHDIEQFYEHQKRQWDKLREAQKKFELNRAALEQDESAKAALSGINEVLESPAPYGKIRQSEELIRAASTVNDALIGKRRERALAAIDEQAQLVTDDFSKAECDEAFKRSALQPFVDLRQAVQRQESLAHIEQAIGEATRLKDIALEQLEAHTAESPGGNAEDEGSLPKIKPRRIVTPSKLSRATYLETEEEVSRFLDSLRAELEDALAKGERIEIR